MMERAFKDGVLMKISRKMSRPGVIGQNWVPVKCGPRNLSWVRTPLYRNCQSPQLSAAVHSLAEDLYRFSKDLVPCLNLIDLRRPFCSLINAEMEEIFGVDIRKLPKLFRGHVIFSFVEMYEDQKLTFLNVLWVE